MRSYHLGTLLGFPIRVNLTFLLLLGFVVLVGGGQGWMGGVESLLVVLLAFSSVLVHELGHALTARHLGVGMSGIELHFFGGAAMMKSMPRSPGDEVVIAAAGPAVSFALAGLGYAAFAITGWYAFAIIAMINLVLGAFNLIPAFPTDGGRILRALMARRYGLIRATDIAVKVGRYAAVAMVIVAFATAHYQLILLAGVLWLMGGSERLAARLRGDHGAWRAEAEHHGGGDHPAVVQEVEYIPPDLPMDKRHPLYTARREAPAPIRRVVMVWRS